MCIRDSYTTYEFLLDCKFINIANLTDSLTLHNLNPKIYTPSYPYLYQNSFVDENIICNWEQIFDLTHFEFLPCKVMSGILLN